MRKENAIVMIVAAFLLGMSPGIWIGSYERGTLNSGWDWRFIAIGALATTKEANDTTQTWMDLYDHCLSKEKASP